MEGHWGSFIGRAALLHCSQGSVERNHTEVDGLKWFPSDFLRSAQGKAGILSATLRLCHYFLQVKIKNDPIELLLKYAAGLFFVSLVGVQGGDPNLFTVKVSSLCLPSINLQKNSKPVSVLEKRRQNVRKLYALPSALGTGRVGGAGRLITHPRGGGTGWDEWGGIACCLLWNPVTAGL